MSESKLTEKVEKKRNKIAVLRERVKESREETAETQRLLEEASRKGSRTAESSELPYDIDEMKVRVGVAL